MNSLAKLIFQLLILLAFDVVVIWLLVYQMDPDPSGSIIIFLLIPLVIVINLLLAGLFYLIKKKRYSALLLANTILSAIVMNYLFGNGIRRHQQNQLESWEFKKADTVFYVTRWKKVNSFDMAYSISKGSSTGFLTGICNEKNGGFILTTDSTRYLIKNDYLMGFRKAGDTIKMKERVP